MTKFQGSFEELKRIVENTGIAGAWQELQNGQKQFRAKNGSILNWWESKGTILFQGVSPAKEDLQSRLEASLEGEVHFQAITPSETKIFIVHGHDTEAREQLELILHRLKLTPFVLQNSSGNGLTIIEALEVHIKNGTEFGIVLMTPDDKGYPEGKETEVQPRARQNVVLEMGMLLSSLGRSNVAILKKGHLEPPSDVNGILYYGFNSHVKETVPKLIEHMRRAGIQIAEEDLIKAMH